VHGGTEGETNLLKPEGRGVKQRKKCQGSESRAGDRRTDSEGTEAVRPWGGRYIKKKRKRRKKEGKKEKEQRVPYHQDVGGREGHRYGEMPQQAERGTGGFSQQPDRVVRTGGKLLGHKRTKKNCGSGTGQGEKRGGTTR